MQSSETSAANKLSADWNGPTLELLNRCRYSRKRAKFCYNFNKNLLRTPVAGLNELEHNDTVELHIGPPPQEAAKVRSLVPLGLSARTFSLPYSFKCPRAMPIMVLNFHYNASRFLLFWWTIFQRSRKKIGGST